MHDFDRKVLKGDPKSLKTILILFLFGFILAMLFGLLSGCGNAYSTSGAAAQWSPNLQKAYDRVQARDPRWLGGITNIVQTTKPPPSGVNYAGVNCPGEVVLFNTTLDSSVEHLEALLIHEGWEIRHDCRDYDTASAEVVQCYRDGGSFEECTERVEREFY